MSVFRQLMMRRYHSAVNYMNLDIVGSPTIQDGVVSNFSTSNYLESSETYDFSQSWEIVLKLKTDVSDSSGYLRIFGNDNAVFASL